jgi:hypothetical protein
MREERGNIPGKQIISDPVDLWGNIIGDTRVILGGKMYIRGSVIGNLTVEDGGRVHIYGNVTGDLVVQQGAKVILSGVVGRDAINRGGRLYVEGCARILGKLRRKSGETNVDRKAKVRE